MKPAQHGDFACAQSVEAYAQTNGFVVQKPAAARRVGAYHRWGKRAFDVTCVVFALPVVIPIIAICVVLLRLSGGSAFYCQDRIGKDGTRFSIWKLRSMVPEADRILATYLAQNPRQKAQWDIFQKLENDPRITPFGRFLRASSVDELPQLWNVLKGDMSLVGPRPMLPEQMEIHSEYAAYCAHLPGLTGLWQVSDRNACSFGDRAKYDLKYHNSIGFGGDVVILLRTIGVILRRNGR